jgi:HSP20 family protein
MHTIIHPTKSASRHRTAEPAPEVQFRKPVYDCQDESGALKLTVYVPGVEAAGVSIEARGPDLLVTARKTHFVRVNWQALHLETAQRDYRLKLRLGRGFVYETMQAEIHQGVLAVTLPKRAVPPAGAVRLRRVA